MSQAGSYKVDKIARSAKLEIKRLRGQVELFWNKELKRYRDFGLKDGMSAVEFGCGPGYLMEKLLQSFPNMNVTGVEIDPVLIEEAKKNLSEKGYSNRFEVFHKSVMDTGIADNTFDFAITRLVLEHLPDPLNAVREIRRVLKPGGKAVFIDNDFEMHLKTYPNIPELRELYDAYCESRSAEGGNPKIGRELPLILRQGGFSNIDFEIISAHSVILGDEIFLESEGVGIPAKLVQDGYLNSKVLGKIAFK